MSAQDTRHGVRLPRPSPVGVHGRDAVERVMRAWQPRDTAELSGWTGRFHWTGQFQGVPRWDCDSPPLAILIGDLEALFDRSNQTDSANALRRAFRIPVETARYKAWTYERGVWRARKDERAIVFVADEIAQMIADGFRLTDYKTNDLHEALAMPATACPRCGAPVRERPLLTGTFVGCLC